MIYREERDVTKDLKQDYLEGLNRVIEQRQREAAEQRSEYIKEILRDPDGRRQEFLAALGWPLVGHTDAAPPEVTLTELSREEGYTLYRAGIRVLPGLTMQGLLFKLDGEERRPLVIVQHGWLGTPEFISGVYGGTANYNDMLQRTLKQGVHAFAPQLLMWAEDYGVPFDRRQIDGKLKRLGSSVTAVEIYGIMRALDYFETRPYVSTFGMLGLSYGGFFSLVTPAAEPRIKAAIAGSFFGQRDAHFSPEWTWFDSGRRFDDAEWAALIYPRKLWIQMGDEDWLYKNTRTEEAYEELVKGCEEVGTDWVKYLIFHGVHEYAWDDGPIAGLVEELHRWENT